jgi:hypothetical protein
MERGGWQLDLFGGPAMRTAEPRRDPVEASCDGAVSHAHATAGPATDPRQVGLFDGPLMDLGALQIACEVPDPQAASAIWQRIQRRHPGWAKGQAWPRWLDDLSRLVGGTTNEQEATIAHAREVLDADMGSAWFAGMPGGLRERIARAAAAAAARSLVAARGPGACSDDGRPLAWVLFFMGAREEGLSALREAAAARPEDGRLRGYLAEALWRHGQEGPAVREYLRACLIADDPVDEEEATCTPVLDLVDRAIDLDLPGPPAAWAPVLADLAGVCSLRSLPDVPVSAAGPAARAAALLRELREAGNAPAASMMEKKRALLRLAPGLGQFLRVMR